MRHTRLASAVSCTALAALLAACGTTNPNPPVSSYPSSSPFPTASSYPSQAPTYPSAGVYPSGQAAAAAEWGRVTDIQTVSMGATSATNPNVGRAVVGGIIGAVVGNVVGKNVNNGHNRSAATAIGAAGGAAVASGMGRNDANSTASSGGSAPAYRVTVQTDQGSMRTYEVGATGDLRIGDRVRVENGVIYRS